VGNVTWLEQCSPVFFLESLNEHGQRAFEENFKRNYFVFRYMDVDKLRYLMSFSVGSIRFESIFEG